MDQKEIFMTSHSLDTAALLQQCRRLFIRRHEVQARIGIHDFEKGVTQRLWIDVDLYVPYASTTPSQDLLEEVVDYDFIRQVIAQRIAKHPALPSIHAEGVHGLS